MNRVLQKLFLICLFADISWSLSLDNSLIIVDANEASYVHHTIGELQQQIKAINGIEPFLSYQLEDALNTGTLREYGYTLKPDTLVIVGRKMTEQLDDKDRLVPVIDDEDPGEQGFVLKTVKLSRDKPAVIVAGSDSMGTNYGLMLLRQLLIESASGLELSDNLDHKESPYYKTRGLYIHQHWKYHYPYATWSWGVEDWKRAIDIAAYCRVNLIMIWPHVDTLAPPLNNAEIDYLQDLRVIIDYAHRKRGIRIYAVEPPNVVIDDKSAKALPMARRHYYEYVTHGKPSIKNPNDQKDYKVLMANRKVFYEYVPNLDGVVFIDGDPGGWPDSSSQEFVDIFKANRTLLDKYATGPGKPILSYWIWFSWGKGSRDDNRAKTLELMNSQLEEPWELLFCQTPQYDPNCYKLIRDNGFGIRAVFFPYGQVEDDGVLSLTQINYESIARHIDSVEDLDNLKGTMGNVLSILVQLPNIYYFTNYSWGDLKQLNEVDALRELARRIFPEHTDILAGAWSQLNDLDSKSAFDHARKIEQICQSNDFGRVGTIGQYVFPEPQIILRDMAVMLRIYGKACRVYEISKGSDSSPMKDAMIDFYSELLDWRKRNGYFGTYFDNNVIHLPRFLHAHPKNIMTLAWEAYLEKQLETDKLKNEVVQSLIDKGYTEWIVHSVTDSLWKKGD